MNPCFIDVFNVIFNNILMMIYFDDFFMALLMFHHYNHCVSTRWSLRSINCTSCWRLTLMGCSSPCCYWRKRSMLPSACPRVRTGNTRSTRSWRDWTLSAGTGATWPRRPESMSLDRCYCTDVLYILMVYCTLVLYLLIIWSAGFGLKKILEK